MADLHNVEDMDYMNTAITLLGMLLGGTGLGVFVGWKAQRRKANAEANSADANAKRDEASAAKELQDVYQQLINDVKADRDEQKSYIQELKDDRRHLREERNLLTERQDQLEEEVRSLKSNVARNGRIVESMRPFLCGKIKCASRTNVSLNCESDAEE